MTVRFYSSVAQETQLIASITGSSTVIQVASTTGFPASTPFTLSLDYESIGNELVDVTGVAGPSLTVTRGVDGTSATSHNAGARVRHVTSARDETDSRTHENSTTNVHGTGIGSAVVGTTTTQTLTNKTLTSPVLNGGTINTITINNGTLNNSVFTGTTMISSELSVTRSLATDLAFDSKVTGDAFNRFEERADGKISMGSGALATDVSISREAAGVFRFDGTVRNYGASTTSDVFQARVVGDTNSRMNMDADGSMSWGPGGATTQDLTLARTGAAAMTISGTGGFGDLTVTGQMNVNSDLFVSGNIVAGGLGVDTGVGMFKRPFKAADTTITSSTTLALDPHLQVTGLLAGTYIMTVYGFLQTNAANAGIAVGITAPTGTVIFGGSGPHNSMVSSSGVVTEWIARSGATPNSLNIPYGNSTSVPVNFQLNAQIVTSATGTIGLQWCQRVSSASGTTLLKGSYMTIERIA